MSQASLDDLNLCPGFGKVKARRVKDAFDKPFYPGRKAPTVSSQSKGKGKERAQEHDVEIPSIDTNAEGIVLGEAEEDAIPHAGREFSPDWDIELDLNGSDEENEATAPQAGSPSPKAPSTKKRKPNPFPM